MKFRRAVEGTPDVANAYRPGLQAVPPVDRRRMTCSKAAKLAGSINLDEAVKALYPNAARWDYGIGLSLSRQDDRVIWVEVHPAVTSNVKDMIRKLDWLRNWLRTSAPKIRTLGENQFHWIASGRVDILRNSPQTRVLAQSGIRFPTRHVDLDMCYK